MEEMLEKIKAQAVEVAKELDAQKGMNTVVLDLTSECAWTSFFVITTATSSAHMRGMSHEVRKKLDELGLQARTGKKDAGDQGWNLIDCSDIVVHVMSEEAREFYDLESRWFSAHKVYSSEEE